jgi:hypothetical protein
LCQLVESRPLSQPGRDEPATSMAFIEWYQKLIAARAGTLTSMVNGQLNQLSATLPTAAQMLETALTEAEAAAGR